MLRYLNYYECVFAFVDKFFAKDFKQRKIENRIWKSSSFQCFWCIDHYGLIFHLANHANHPSTLIALSKPCKPSRDLANHLSTLQTILKPWNHPATLKTNHLATFKTFLQPCQLNQVNHFSPRILVNPRLILKYYCLTFSNSYVYATCVKNHLSM